LECQPDKRGLGSPQGPSVLTSACLRACGASPRHSANLVDGRWLIAHRIKDIPVLGFQPSTIPAARVAQREPLVAHRKVLISGIALDQCRDPERYRTRVPSSKSKFENQKSDCGCSSIAESGLATAASPRTDTSPLQCGRKDEPEKCV
jgi:hypothetical protein